MKMDTMEMYQSLHWVGSHYVWHMLEHPCSHQIIRMGWQEDFTRCSKFVHSWHKWEHNCPSLLLNKQLQDFITLYKLLYIWGRKQCAYGLCFHPCCNHIKQCWGEVLMSEFHALVSAFTSFDGTFWMASTISLAWTFWRNSSSSSVLLVLHPSAFPRRNALSRPALVNPHQWKAVPVWEMARW